MEIRKFNFKSKGRREGSCGVLDTFSSSFTFDCVICFEKYIDGEVMVEVEFISGGYEVYRLVEVYRIYKDRVSCFFFIVL